MNPSPPATGRTPSKYYAVANGHRPGIYTDWPSAQRQITGWQKPKHKSFSTYAEAEAYIKQAQAAAPQSATTADEGPAAKRPKQRDTTPTINGMSVLDTTSLPGTTPLAADAEDGFDNRIVLDAHTGKLRWKTAAELAQTRAAARIDNVRDEVAVYTDGACRANGRRGAVAGVGVFFGANDPR